MKLTDVGYYDLAEAEKGYCTGCKKWTDGGVKPHAKGLECPSCGQKKVLGVEHCLLGKIIFLVEGN